MRQSKIYDELDFTDDFMFCKVLQENEDLCKELVKLITGKTVRSIIKPEKQKSITLTADGKGIRLDVYFEDEEETVYDIEMQTTKSRDLAKRSRYYQGMIDLNILNKGEGYNNLKESLVIFICTFDLFDKGRHKYSFENMCREVRDLHLNDGTQKLFLCCTEENDEMSDDMRAFLRYITKKEEGSPLTKRIAAAVEDARGHQEWRDEYMTLFLRDQEMREQGRAEGRAEGGVFKVYELIQEGILSVEDGSKNLGISPEELIKDAKTYGYTISDQ